MPNSPPGLAQSSDYEQMTKFFAHCAEIERTKEDTIKNLLWQLNNQEQKIRDLSLDLDDQKASRSRYQADFNFKKNALAKLQEKIDRNSFVVALIDGDGAKFTDELLQDQQDGGATAAHRLKQAIRDQVGDNDVTVIVKIWGNLDGLAHTLFLKGSIRTGEQMHRFAADFSRSLPEFDFINVGKGKENADSKMRKLLNFYWNNVQCKKIFFAGCHDNGYLHELQEKRGEAGAEERLILLETTAAEPAFNQLGFQLVRFDNVFRSTPLPNDVLGYGAASHTAAKTPVVPKQVAITPSSTPPPPPASVVVDDKNPVPATSVQRSSSTTEHNTVKASGNGGVSLSYATAGGSTQHDNVTLARKSVKHSKVIVMNKDHRRLDPPVKRPTGQAQKTYYAKLDAISPNVFCNEYYLARRCSHGASCGREHETILTPAEIAVHRARARGSGCPDLCNCADYDCYLSHHCPMGAACTRDDCKFSVTFYGDLHFRKAEDMKPAYRWIEGQDEPETL